MLLAEADTAKRNFFKIRIATVKQPHRFRLLHPQRKNEPQIPMMEEKTEKPLIYKSYTVYKPILDQDGPT